MNIAKKFKIKLAMVGVCCLVLLLPLYLLPVSAWVYYMAADVLCMTGLCWWIVCAPMVKRVTRLVDEFGGLCNKYHLIINNKNTDQDELATIIDHVDEILHLTEVGSVKQQEIGSMEKKNLQHKIKRLEEDLLKLNGIKKEFESLRQDAWFDRVTNLPNHKYLSPTFSQSLSRARLEDSKIGLFLLQIVNLEEITADLGRLAGEAVLKEVAIRLKKLFQDDRWLARGREAEFIFLWNRAKEMTAFIEFVQHVIAAVSMPVVTQEVSVCLHVNIGAAIFPTHGLVVKDLLRNANIALMEGLQNKRSTFCFYDDAMGDKKITGHKLENAMRQAFANKELLLYYQPIVDQRTRQIVGVEALLRWMNSSFGVICPSRFLPIVGNSDFFTHLYEWTVKQACYTVGAWQQQGFAPLKLAVNVSARQLRYLDVASIIAVVLHETGLSSKVLDFEISSLSMKGDMAVMIEKIQALRRIGVGICMENFADSHVSLRELTDLPLSRLLVGAELVKEINNGQVSQLMADAIMALAHALKLDVLAKGVEAESQAQSLIKRGCHLLQGYYICPPLPEAELLAKLKASSVVMQ